MNLTCLLVLQLTNRHFSVTGCTQCILQWQVERYKRDVAVLYWPVSYVIPSGLFNPIQIVWAPSWSSISHWHWKNPHHKAGCVTFCSWLRGLLCYFTSLDGVSWIRVRVGVNSICSSRLSWVRNVSTLWESRMGSQFKISINSFDWKRYACCIHSKMLWAPFTFFSSRVCAFFGKSQLEVKGL